MKSLIKNIIVGLLILVSGLMIGKYFLAPSTKQQQSHADHPISSSEETTYTCSMHPQIRQNEPGICPICEMELIPVDDNSASDDPTILKMTKESVKLAQIETSTVGNAATLSVGKPVVAEGQLKLDERLTNIQSSHIGGRLEKLYVNFTGEYVKKGQLIAEIYSPELLTASKELLTAVKNEERFPGLKKAAIEKLKNWKITTSIINTIIDSGQPLDRVKIYADFSGIVMDKKVANGDHVMEGEALFTIANTSRLWAVFNVFESELSLVKKGQNIRFHTPSIPGETFTSTVSFIDPILDNHTQSVPVRATITNRGGKLKPGMLLKGEIINTPSNADDILMVPKTAVLWTGKKSVIYIQDVNQEIPTFQYREVTLGDSKGEYYVVTSGIKAGDRVVTHGAFAVDAAAQLSNKKSMINQNISIKSDQITTMVPDYSRSTTSTFNNQVHEVIQEYLKIKNALVETDTITTANAANQLLKSLDKVDMTEVSGEGHQYWMNQLKAIRAHATNIAQSKVVNKQREQFEFLSDAIIFTIKAFGIGKDTLYVQYCPMAFDNKGADWISSDDFIRNPYFGDQMLKCGMITDTLIYN